MHTDPQYQPTSRDDRPRHTVAEWGALTLAATVGGLFLALFQAMMIVGGGFTATRVVWLGGSLVVVFFGVVLMAGRGVARAAKLAWLAESAELAASLDEALAEPSWVAQP